MHKLWDQKHNYAHCHYITSSSLCNIFYKLCACIPYLPVYNSTPHFGAKNKFFLFLCNNFLEKLIFYLRISFQTYYGFMKKITATLIKFTISVTWAFRVLKRHDYKLHFLHNFLNKLTKSNILIFNEPLSLWRVVKQV